MQCSSSKSIISSSTLMCIFCTSHFVLQVSVPYRSLAINFSLTFLNTQVCSESSGHSCHRLWDWTAAELPPYLQRVGIHQPVQVRWLHGHVARQVVQGGPLWEKGFCRHRGETFGAATWRVTRTGDRRTPSSLWIAPDMMVEALHDTWSRLGRRYLYGVVVEQAQGQQGTD